MKAGKMTKLAVCCCCFGMLAMYGEKESAQEIGQPDYMEESENWETEILEENEETEDLEEITVEDAAEEEGAQILDLTVETDSGAVTDAEDEAESELITEMESEPEMELVTDTESEPESELVTDTESEPETEPATEDERQANSEVLAVIYEIKNQSLESGKTFEDIVVPEYAIAEDGSEVEGEVQWKIPGCGIVVDSDMEISGEDGENLMWEWTFVPDETEEYETAEGMVELTLYTAKELAGITLPDTEQENEKEMPAIKEAGNTKEEGDGKKTASGSITGSANEIRLPSVKDAAKWMGSAMTGIDKIDPEEDDEVRQAEEKLTISHGTIKRDKNASKEETALPEDKKEAERQEKEKTNRESVSGTEADGKAGNAGEASAGSKKDTVRKTDIVDKADTISKKNTEAIRKNKLLMDKVNPERKSNTAKVPVKLHDTRKESNKGKTVISGRNVTDRTGMIKEGSAPAVSATADRADNGIMIQKTGFSGAESTQPGISRSGIFRNLWQIFGKGLLCMLFSGFGFLK